MELTIALQGGFSLVIADHPMAIAGHPLAIADHPTEGKSGGNERRGARSGGSAYPTARLQKGLLLRHGDQDLAEEGVGFGVPVLKRGIETIFPSNVELAWRRMGSVWEVTGDFEMNLVERLAKPGGEILQPRPLYAAKNALAAVHRRCPPLRGALNATSDALRRLFGLATTFEHTASTMGLRVSYVIDAERGRVGVAVDGVGAVDGITELVLMNEQGARQFDRYVDAEGTTLRGGQIGTWDPVAAQWAGFINTAHGVAFSLGQVPGARLYRGRELIGSRVAWSGFGYSVGPLGKRLSYDVSIETIP